VRGYRHGDNPAQWRNHLEHALADKAKAAQVHHAALPYAELPAFMAALRQRQEIAARALEFTILTAARSGEINGAKWDEIDGAVWTIPAGRMKASKEHRVPLSARAVALLRDLPREDGTDFIFVGSQQGSGLSKMALGAVLKRMGRTDITVHGFRSTFMDWAHETTAFPKVVIDMALAHVVGDKVEAAYRRGDLLRKRSQLTDAWGKYCGSTPAVTAATVVPIRA
jgi:integrase